MRSALIGQEPSSLLPAKLVFDRCRCFRIRDVDRNQGGFTKLKHETERKQQLLKRVPGASLCLRKPRPKHCTA